MERTITLEELFDTDQLKSIDQLVGRIRSGKAPITALKVFLQGHREKLETQEVLPEYLYYALIYNLGLPL